MDNRDKDRTNKFVTDFLAQSSNLTGGARWFTYFDTHPTDLETGNSGLWDFKDVSHRLEKFIRDEYGTRGTELRIAGGWIYASRRNQDVPFRYRIASREYHSLSPIFITGEGKPNAEVMFHGKVHLTFGSPYCPTDKKDDSEPDYYLERGGLRSPERGLSFREGVYTRETQKVRLCCLG